MQWKMITLLSMWLKLGNVAVYIDSYMQQKGLVKILQSLLGFLFENDDKQVIKNDAQQFFKNVNNA